MTTYAAYWLDDSKIIFAAGDVNKFVTRYREEPEFL